MASMILREEGDVMSIEFISKEVAQVIQKYQESDPWRLAQAMGIIVGYSPMGTNEKSCKGFFLYQSRKMHITLNSDLSKPLQRIILAHEIGHAVLHCDVAKVKAFHDFSIYDSTNQYEYEANLFAADYLLRDVDVVVRQQDAHCFFTIAQIREVPPELLDFKLRILRHNGVLYESPIVAKSDFLKDISESYGIW